TAQAGATNKQVAEAARDAGLTGYEFASGIPGSIGGAAIMNAGAYDGELKDVGVSVTCLTLEGEVVTVSAADAQWSYRHSMMSDRGYIVLDATIQLVSFDKDKISARMAELKQRREDKQPLELGSAGSTFKRPIGFYAGKLIQDAGMQGHTVGRAQVSTKHAGFVVNMGGATAAEIRQVIVDVQNAVFADAGVHLETEVRMWGFDD
ncbi:MAG: UDP-N-acetylmuramate dehydrogenase, partial [Coriobacteriales bacterium]|nr:UDP-N-acetylmuramate dehydrogenase [Coriobacteriales bacterium]